MEFTYFQQLQKSPSKSVVGGQCSVAMKQPALGKVFWPHTFGQVQNVHVSDTRSRLARLESVSGDLVATNTLGNAGMVCDSCMS